MSNKNPFWFDRNSRYHPILNLSLVLLFSFAIFYYHWITFRICATSFDSTISTVMVENGSIHSGISATQEVIFDHPADTLKVGLLGFVYILSNNCFYVAATYLDAATFAVSSQLKLLTTAVFAVLILRKQLSPLQWVSLLILFAGVSTVQFPTSSGSKKTPGHSEASTTFLGHGENVLGFLMSFLACALTGFAGVYFEKILKSKGPNLSVGEISVWMRNFVLAFLSVPIAITAAMIQDGHIIRNHGLLYGFDYLVWLTVLWHSIGGLSVALCIKFTDNIEKNFATSVSILLSTVISIYVFNSRPSVDFAIGAAIVIGAIFMYSKYPAASKSAVVESCDPRIVEMERSGVLSALNNHENSETVINISK